jgi:hypothetical protein
VGHHAKPIPGTAFKVINATKPSDKADLLSLDELRRLRSFILSNITIFRN